MNQADFLDAVKQALADTWPGRNPDILTPAAPQNRDARLAACNNRPRAEQLALLDQLTASAQALNITLVTAETPKAAQKAIVRLVREKEPEYGTAKKVAAWDHPLIKDLDLAPALAEADIPLVLAPAGQTRDTQKDFRQAVIESFVGITSADYCVAETATLTMKTRAGQPRNISLVPVIHVAVVRLDQLVENLSELYFRLEWDPKEQAEGLTNCMTFISGPSKTGDIELVMVHGAHGPRELHLVVITGEDQ